MGIVKATERYEAWLAGFIMPVPNDVQTKHEKMATLPFAFLRATFYRWAARWPKICEPLMNAPPVLAVGDLHLENFGTWRDTSGRLIWGINDLDEAFPLPYTHDLTRLAGSVMLSIDAHQITLKPDEACGAILAGYQEGMGQGGKPFVLEGPGNEAHWLLRILQPAIKPAEPFWQKLNTLPATHDLPKPAVDALASVLPAPNAPFRYATRVAGLGSLGRQRFVALGTWKGEPFAREAKALAPSAVCWAWKTNQYAARDGALYERLLRTSVRAADPLLQTRNGWVVRRLAPDSTRVELSAVADTHDALRLLHAMGWETANLHLGTRNTAPAILSDLATRPPKWLLTAAQAMATDVGTDWQAWKDRAKEAVLERTKTDEGNTGEEARTVPVLPSEEG